MRTFSTGCLWTAEPLSLPICRWHAEQLIIAVSKLPETKSKQQKRLKTPGSTILSAYMKLWHYNIAEILINETQKLDNTSKINPSTSKLAFCSWRFKLLKWGRWIHRFWLYKHGACINKFTPDMQRHHNLKITHGLTINIMDTQIEGFSFKSHR